MNIGNVKAWAPLPIGGLLLLNACVMSPGTTVDQSNAAVAPVVMKNAIEQSNIQFTNAKINARVKINHALQAYQKQHRNSRVGEVLPAVDAWDFYDTYHGYKYPMSLPAISILGFGAGIEHEGGIKIYVDGQVMPPVVQVAPPVVMAPVPSPTDIELPAPASFASAVPTLVTTTPLAPLSSAHKPNNYVLAIPADVEATPLPAPVVEKNNSVAAADSASMIGIYQKYKANPGELPAYLRGFYDSGKTAYEASHRPQQVTITYQAAAMPAATHKAPAAPTPFMSVKPNATQQEVNIIIDKAIGEYPFAGTFGVDVNPSKPVDFSALHPLRENALPPAGGDKHPVPAKYKIPELVSAGSMAAICIALATMAASKRPKYMREKSRIFNRKKGAVSLWSKVGSGSRIGGDFAAAALGMTLRTATAFPRNAWNNKTEIGIGMASSLLTKTAIKAALPAIKAIAFSFHLAAAVTTMPAWVGLAAGAIALGAVAGGVSGLVKAIYKDYGQERQQGWALRAILRGAAFGAVGGAVGEGIISVVGHTEIGQHLGSVAVRAYQHSGVAHLGSGLHNLFHTGSLPVQTNMATGLSASHMPAAPISPAPAMVVQHSPVAAVKIVSPTAPTPKPEIIVSHPATPVTAPAHIVTQAAVPAVDPTQLDVTKLLTPAQMHSLPASLQKLALSQDPNDIARFCKEASFRLIQNHQEAAGSLLIEKGQEFVNANNIHSITAQQLNRDAGYEYMGHDGVTRNLTRAATAFGKAGSYGKQFLAALVKPMPA